MATVQQVKNKTNGKKIVTVYDFMQQKKDLIASALPKTITPDRLIGVFNMILRSSPQLSNCSQSSLIAAVIGTVQLGLQPGNIGHVHFVPFDNKKKGTKEVQLIVGYKGMVELVNRSKKATILYTEVVYENDFFEYEQGLAPKLRHVPTEGERGEFKGVYCVAKNLLANERVFVYMPKKDIDKVRASSKAGKSEYSPWSTWYDEMSKKTVIKRICKVLPLSSEEQKKISLDETVKNEIAPDMTEVRDETPWEESEDAEIVDDKQGKDGWDSVQPEPIQKDEK